MNRIQEFFDAPIKTRATRRGLFLMLLPCLVLGQTPQDQAPSASAPAPVQQAPAIQILEQYRRIVGNRSIIYNRIAPPVLPKRPTPTPPAPEPLTPEEAQAEKLRDQKDWKPFFFSAVIYDHRITELTWGDKSQYRAYSNIDFNHFCGIGNVETDTTVYEIYFMPYNAASGNDREAMRPLPPPQAFSPNRFEYLLDETAPAPPAEARAAMDALHAYYNANGKKLAADYLQNVAKRSAQEQWRKAHPPAPRDTVVNFWPIKSGVYLKEQKQGGAQ